MTVCIAAECNEGSEKRLILCTDWRTSSALGRADTKVKQLAIRRNWWCLTAGAEHDILALYEILTRTFQASAKVDETYCVALVRSALAARKREKTEELIQGQYAISYEDFLNFGKTKLPDDLYREAIRSVGNIQLGASLIVAGFSPDKTTNIVRTTEQGQALLQEDFATIGEGSYLAQAALLQREYIGVSELSKALYCIYEAKKIAERVTSVSEDTQVTVLAPDGTFRDVSDPGLDFLGDCYKRFGPQRIDAKSLSKATTFLKLGFRVTTKADKDDDTSS